MIACASVCATISFNRRRCRAWRFTMPRSLADEADVIDIPQPFRAIDLEDFLARKFPPRENLLSPWLAAKGLAMVFAPRGVGKTHFALGVAYAVASGGSFLKWK